MLFAHPAASPAQKRGRTAHISGLLQLLRAHGLIAKVPRNPYRVTSKGKRL